MRNGFLVSGFGFLVGAGAATFLPAQATRTATPAPRLSGGFGRPRSTPPPTAAASGGGQSLADVVHAAQQSRDGEKPEKGGLTISNRSLVTASDKGRVSTSKLQPPKASSAPTPAVMATPAAGASTTGGTEAEWRATAARARKRVADDKARVAELEAASKKLENDFYAWDDGQYRDRVIKPAWDHARSELADAQSELAEAEKDLADLPEKARKAGALPGWIR